MVWLWPFTMHLFSEFVLETDEETVIPSKVVNWSSILLGAGEFPGFGQSEHKNSRKYFFTFVQSILS